MKIQIILFLLCFTLPCIAQKIKVACVGNSVTYGYLLSDRDKNCYPAQLQCMLGDKYQVENFGKSGATLLNKGHRPYMQQEEYQKALDFAADYVIIHLGLNDTDPRNWPNYRDDFVSDYLALINSFQKANRNCKIWICKLSPITNSHPRFKSGTREWYWQIQQTIEEIASIAQTGLIDLQESLYNHPELLPDAIHPNIEGATVLAHTVHQALTGNYGGLQMPIIYSDNMVLQRNQPLSFSGIANAGDKVIITIGNQKKETTTGADGKWNVSINPLSTGPTYTLSIATKDKKLIYNNILAGEVWLCSGQSNMAFRIDESVTEEQQEQLKYAKNKTTIRLFDMKPRWETFAVEWNNSVLDSLNHLQYYKETTWKECNQETADRFSAVAFAFGRMLADSLQVPIGLVLNAVGGSPTEAWIDRKTLEFEFPDILQNWTQNDFIQGWVRERAVLNIKKSENKAQRHPYEPCYLYEAGILPLSKYSIKGIIWYQGESNAHNIEVHEKLFPLLVNSWRKNWDKDIPFYYVQLSSLSRPSWPRFRDSQRHMLQRIPNTGMAVSSDLGDSLNVHPTYKKVVGERLARWALNRTYNLDLLPSGPLFKGIEVEGHAAFLSFDYSEGLQTADGKDIQTFEVAESDGMFFPAQAQIIGEKVKVWSSNVAYPRFVRYGWEPFTRANLINKNGLPASTFRIEKIK